MSAHLKTGIWTLIIVSYCFVSSPHPSYGGIIFSHNGDADPTTEGWAGSPSVLPPGVTVGGISNDIGSGFDAWFVNDGSDQVGSGLSYTQTTDSSLNNQALAVGWSLRTRLRVANNGDSPGSGSIYAAYTNGLTGYVMIFGSQPDGDPSIILTDGTASGGLAGGSSFTLESGGNGYHLYELIFDPNAGSADLFIDGTERISNYTGYSLSSSIVAFGSGSSDDTGQGNFNLVEFSVATVPEPASLTLWGMSLAGLCCYGIRRHKAKHQNTNN